jgi:hypothetical protein
LREFGLTTCLAPAGIEINNQVFSIDKAATAEFVEECPKVRLSFEPLNGTGG